MKTAVAQTRAGVEIGANLTSAERLIAEAADRSARWVVLPEYFACYGAEAAIKGAVRWTDEIVRRLGAAAKKGNLWITAGGVVRTRHGKFYNDSLIINPAGEMTAYYAKRHLFTATIGGRRYGEGAWLQPGREYTITPVNRWKIGLATCFDLRYPEHFARLRAGGAKAIAIGAAFTAVTGAAHWTTLVAARAVETQCYVVAAGLTGASDELYVHGHSMIVDPWGEIMAAMTDGEGVAVADISATRVEEIRRVLPMRGRKP
jgi:nitrilase